MFVNRALVSANVIATASSIYGPGLTPDKAFDASDTSSWATAIGQGLGAWLKVDLLEAYEITRVRLYQYENINNSASRYRLESSNNNVDWNLALEVQCNTEYEQTYDLENPITARYWRIVSVTGCSQNWNVRAWELKEWADAGVPDENSTTAQLIQWVWDNTYQETFSALDDLFPLWDYQPMDAWHIAFHVAVWKYVLAMPAGGGGVGECLFDPTDILAAIANLDADLQSAQTVIATNDNANTATITGAIGTAQEAIETALEASQTAIETNDNTNTSALVTHINTQRDAINLNVDQESVAIRNQQNLDTSAILQAITNARTLLQTYIDNKTLHLDQSILNSEAGVRGLEDQDLTAVMSALNQLDQRVQSLQASDLSTTAWPGIGGATLGAPVLVTGPVRIVGPMDGIQVVIDQVPPGQSAQPCGPTTRFKGVAWVAFETDAGDFEPLQSLQYQRSLVRPQDMLQAAAVAVYCKAGSRLTVRPYTVNQP